MNCLAFGNKILISVFLTALIILNTQANAAYVDLTKRVGDSVIDNSDPFSIEFSNLPVATSDALITFTVFGDFSNQHEWIDLSADEFSFGRWLNRTNTDDIIKSQGTSDSSDTATLTINEYVDPIIGVATIPLDILMTLLADGQINFEFDYNRDPNVNSVNNLKDGDFAEVRIRYESNVDVAGVSKISEPSMLLLLFAGCLAMMRFPRFCRIKRFSSKSLIDLTEEKFPRIA